MKKILVVIVVLVIVVTTAMAYVNDNAEAEYQYYDSISSDPRLKEVFTVYPTEDCGFSLTNVKGKFLVELAMIINEPDWSDVDIYMYIECLVPGYKGPWRSHKISHDDMTKIPFSDGEKGILDDIKDMFDYMDEMGWG
ncbi:hypothetical protein [Pseudobutyrivibrio sp.]